MPKDRIRPRKNELSIDKTAPILSVTVCLTEPCADNRYLKLSSLVQEWLEVNVEMVS